MDVGAAPLVHPTMGTSSDSLSHEAMSNKSPEIVRGELVEP